MRSLANDRSIVIKKTDKGSCVVVWDREDYIAEAEKQLGEKNIYKDTDFKEKTLQELIETSNSLFKNFKKKGCITEKELKYFSIEFKKATNLGKLYLLPRLINVCLIFHHSQLYQIVVHPQKRFQSS